MAIAILKGKLFASGCLWCDKTAQPPWLATLFPRQVHISRAPERSSVRNKVSCLLCATAIAAPETFKHPGYFFPQVNEERPSFPGTCRPSEQLPLHSNCTDPCLNWWEMLARLFYMSPPLSPHSVKGGQQVALKCACLWSVLWVSAVV